MRDCSDEGVPFDVRVSAMQYRHMCLGKLFGKLNIIYV